MKNMTHIMKLILCLVLVSGITGQLLICQDDSSPSEGKLTCECENGMFYDAYEGKCKNICSYYGDSLCDNDDANYICVKVVQDPMNFTCECRPGYESSINNEDEDICIDELNRCETDTPCSDEFNEECIDLFGSYECVCQQDYYRNENGDCEAWDMCSRPYVQVCDQICHNEDGEPGEYYCECNTGYVINEKDSHSCILEDDAESCICDEHDAWSSCAYLANNDTKVCEPLAGFEFNDRDQIQDIDECKDETQYKCPRHSVCSNLEGKYSCNCVEDYGWNDTLKECKKNTCPLGSALYNHRCYAFCSTELGPQCPYDTVCLVDDNNVPFCDCQLYCQMNGNRDSIHSLYIYELHFSLGYERYYEMKPNDIFQITKSFESTFGRGNTQILSYSRNYVQMAIGLYTALSETEDLGVMVSELCYTFDNSTSEEKCVLPGNIVANSNNFASFDIFPCQYFQNLCSNNAMCSDASTDLSILPGNYKCNCPFGFQLVDDLEEVYCVDINECAANGTVKCEVGYECLNLIGEFRCADIDECYNPENTCGEGYICVNNLGSYECLNNDDNTDYTQCANELTAIQEQLSDQQHKTKVVGGVLGAFFGLTVIILAFALFYIYKRRTTTV